MASRTVVVALFDGWAPSMVDSVETPALDRMRREGAWSHAFVPAFPTNSLVNGVTISTGCWPARHGIVANRFLDPERGFYDHSPDADWLLGCEHLHEVAERQDVRAAALGWYGRRSGTRGRLATHVSSEADYSEYPDDVERAAQVRSLLQMPPGRRPRLILAYFKGPDEAAHFSGLESQATREAVARSDARVAELLAAIEALPDRDSVALFVTTDHGMREVSHLVNVPRILRRHRIPARAVSDGSTALLYFDEPDRVGEAEARLSGYQEFDVFRPSAAPAWARLGTSRRLGDLVLSAHAPYFVADVELWPWWLRWLAHVGPDVAWARFRLKASHGHPPDTPGVAGILYAWGAGIRAGRSVPRVDVVDLHATVAHLLGIGPGRPVDGAVEPALLDPAPGR